MPSPFGLWPRMAIRGCFLAHSSSLHIKADQIPHPTRGWEFPAHLIKKKGAIAPSLCLNPHG